MTTPDLTPEQRAELTRLLGADPALLGPIERLVARMVADARAEGRLDWRREILSRAEQPAVPDSRDELLARLVAEAEQRGREDNTDHGMCYVSGSAALEAREAAAERRGAERVAAAIEAAVRLVYPDEITPVGARQIRAALAQATPDGGDRS